MCLHMKSVILLFVGIAESKYLFPQRYETCFQLWYLLTTKLVFNLFLDVFSIPELLY